MIQYCISTNKSIPTWQKTKIEHKVKVLHPFLKDIEFFDEIKKNITLFKKNYQKHNDRQMQTENALAF